MADYLHIISAFFTTFEDFLKDIKKPSFVKVIYTIHLNAINNKKASNE
jgi:hypothetical protein